MGNFESGNNSMGRKEQLSTDESNVIELAKLKLTELKAIFTKEQETSENQENEISSTQPLYETGAETGTETLPENTSESTDVPFQSEKNETSMTENQENETSVTEGNI
ncbi:MAG: hypothetical protein PHN31_03975 [Candidatus Gracilibacteria bacterium]|nr:hypothetical protein [Candidatus Gracilibacteria bacterium]